jgi:hypothetical protein
VASSRRRSRPVGPAPNHADSTKAATRTFIGEKQSDGAGTHNQDIGIHRGIAHRFLLKQSEEWRCLTVSIISAAHEIRNLAGIFSGRRTARAGFHNVEVWGAIMGLECERVALLGAAIESIERRSRARVHEIMDHPSRPSAE